MKHILATALISACAVGSLTAQSIVGSWFNKSSDSFVVITFLTDGTYFMVEDGRNNDDSGKDGMERGAYTWNASTRSLKTNTQVDTNGEWGLSHFPIKSATVTDSKLKLSSARENFTLTRVRSANNKIVGGWYFKDSGGYGVITFLADGSYMMAEDGRKNDPTGKDGMERGTFTWNKSTNAFSSRTTVDTTRQWGLSHARVRKAAVSATRFVANAIDGRFTLKRVAAPAAKLPEIAINQPAATGLNDGRSTRNLGGATVGKRGKPKTFTITNKGKATLKGIAIRSAGKHSKDLIVGKPGASQLAPGKSTTFKVSIKPRAKGRRNAVIRVASNDADENPFDIKVVGTGR